MSYKEIAIIFQYKVPDLFFISKKETKLLALDDNDLENEFSKLLRQPFVKEVLFPDQDRIQFDRIEEITEDKKVTVIFHTMQEKVRVYDHHHILNMSYMIPGKVSKTKTGLKPLLLYDLERSEIWRIIESGLFKDYIYSSKEMAERLPPDANRHCIKLKELSLEYGELLFSIQLI